MNMETIQKEGKIPFSKQKGDFYDRIAKMSNTASLTGDELHAYHQWLKVKNDDLLRLKKAREEGEAKGRAEGEAKGRAEGEKLQAWKTARILHEANQTIDFISKVTGIPEEELKSNL